MCLAQGHNAVTLLKIPTCSSLVSNKYSTTEPLCATESSLFVKKISLWNLDLRVIKLKLFNKCLLKTNLTLLYVKVPLSYNMAR